MSSPSSSQWLTLPVEIQLTITQLLDNKALRSLSEVSHYDRILCLPAVYNSVTIPSFARLQSFLDHVPVHHASHIRTLDVSTAGSVVTQATCSDALRRILSLTPRLRSLSLHLSTELSPLAISSFSILDQLTDLSIQPCRDAIHTSLSERTVIGVALAVPSLKSLSISCVTLHTVTRLPSLLTHQRSLPTALIPSAPPTLPSLFTIHSLRHLAIHNTALGDPLFASADLTVRCQLETLELGAFEIAQAWSSALVLSAPQNHYLFPVLERVRLTPLFSPSQLPSTLRMLATASGALRHINVECLADDLEDVCEELSECVEHVNGGPYNLKLRVLPALEGDVLITERPVTSECMSPLDENAQEALSRLESAFTSAGTPISIMGTNPEVPQQEDEDWDDLTVVDETGSGVEIKGTYITEDPWVQVGAW
ncbi:hypothetical protein H4582DRAFT_2095550 [Lactarius indigo]|nr:hypothetical protein H4582DRAFT_2095550 [Lactarius indigo]